MSSKTASQVQALVSAPLPWQQPLWRTLIKNADANNLHHALLLKGPKGTGKTLLALKLANYLLCQNKQTEQKPCATCKACHLFELRHHPDFFLIEPDNASKTSVIKIDRIRSLIAASQQSAHQDGYKIFIISPAEAMNPAASNALLKTLEEPNGQRYLLILISHQAALLAATIRSRCLTIHCPLPANDQAQAWLIKQLDHAQSGSAAALLSLSHGSPLDALALGATTSLEDINSLLKDLLFMASEKQNPVITAEKWQIMPTEQLLSWLQLLIKDMLYLKLQIAKRSALWQQNDSLLLKLCDTINIMQLFHFVDHVYELKRYIYQHHNLNKQLMLEALFCQWQEISKP